MVLLFLQTSTSGMNIIDVYPGNYNLEIPASIEFVNTNKFYLQCLTSGGPINISLPLIRTAPAYIKPWGFHIYIADAERNAAANNITIIAAPGDIVYGAAAAIINTNGGAGEAFIAGHTTWGCLIGPPPSSGGGITLSSIFFKTIAAQNNYVFNGTVTAWNPAGIDLIGKSVPLYTSDGLTRTPGTQYTWNSGTGTLTLIGTVFANAQGGVYYQ